MKLPSWRTWKTAVWVGIGLIAVGAATLHAIALIGFVTMVVGFSMDTWSGVKRDSDR